jgi:hypothetical protein
MPYEPKPGDVAIVKLTGARVSVLKWLDPRDHEEVDESIGKKYLVRAENQKLSQVYDCEMESASRSI